MFKMEKIELANKELNKVKDFLEKNEDAFQYMDLKLHDVSYYCGSEEMKEEFPLCSQYVDNYNYDINYFNDFCDINYETFLGDLKEIYGIDFRDMYHQLGRTSKFYLHDRNLIDVNCNGIDYDETFYMFINEYSEANGYGIYTNFVNGKIKIDEDYLDAIRDYEEEVENEIDYIINDFYNDFIGYCEDIITVYKWIEDFKDNQLVYFKDYLTCEEETLEANEELKKENQLRSANICLDIMEKYSISAEDMELLKENINEF